jgi:hypothetical protein
LFGYSKNLPLIRINKNLLVCILGNVLLANSVGMCVAVDSNQQSTEKHIEINVHQPSVKTEDFENELQSSTEIQNASEDQPLDPESDSLISKLKEESEIQTQKDETKSQIDKTQLQVAELQSQRDELQLQKAETDKNDSSKSPMVLQGAITYAVPMGTPIKLKLATVPSHPISLMDRDMEGNLYPARLNQQITARTTEDIFIDNNRIIPEGTILHGSVSKILPPRRVYRQGSLELSFDYLVTPDGKKFAFRAEANNAKKSTAQTKAKGFGIIAAHAAGGAIVGAMVAYQIFGLEKTISMHGYNIAAGAAGGALIATGYAVMRKGPKASLEPGDDLNMVIDTDLLMPVAADKEQKNKNAELPDVRIQVEKSKIDNDGVGGHFVTLDAHLTNDGDADFSSIDLFLEDTNGHRYPLCSGPAEDSQFLFHLEPHSEKHVRMSFLTPYPKLKQQLVWVDHETKSALIRQKFQ